MTPELLERIGHALYGGTWQRAMADDLDVRHDTIRKWADGKSIIPDGIADELRDLLEERVRMIATTLAQLNDAIARAPRAAPAPGMP